MDFRGLFLAINRVIKQPLQETEELKTKVEMGFLSHKRMSRALLCKNSF